MYAVHTTAMHIQMTKIVHGSVWDGIQASVPGVRFSLALVLSFISFGAGIHQLLRHWFTRFAVAVKVN